MFAWIDRLPSFGDKLTWLLTLTSGGAIMIVCIALAAADYVEQRRQTEHSLQAQAMIVAMNSGAPMSFGDPHSAAEALAAFRMRPTVVEATLFDLQGIPFAHYARGDVSPSVAPQPPGTHQVDRWLVVTLPVEDEQQTFGRLQVVHDLQATRARLWRSLLLALAVTIVAVALVYLFSRQIGAALLRPIAALSHTVEQVAASKDYALRAAKLSDDELGRFTGAFNEMLAQIQQQDAELQAARAEAEAASQLKDDFLATLSHELRTPLSPILGWAQILARIAGDDPRLQQAAQVIERSARSQAQIVDDLLDMSRIVSGKLRIELQPVELADVVEAAIDTVQPAADAKNVRLYGELEPVLVRGDPHRLQQVVWNLLSNAVKFTGEGGEVTIRLRSEGGYAEIDVSDSGQGISPEFLPHVFERFRQADSSTTRAHGGLGLGLSIVRQLVELHGGSVRAASAGVGRGATFTVLLPRQAEPDHRATGERRAMRSTPFPPTRTPPLDATRVLVVEADPCARALLMQMLREAGADAHGAGDRPAALQALSGGTIDVLVCDIQLGGDDGLSLIRDVRALPAERGGAVPAIALTALARNEERTHALLAGYQLHVAKPVDRSELQAAIASLRTRPQAPLGA